MQLTLREALSTEVRTRTLASLVQLGKARHPDLASRMERAALILLFRQIEPAGDHTYAVQSDDPQTAYTVNTTDGTCTCPDFSKAPRGWCKHRLALALAFRAADVELERRAHERRTEYERRVAADKASLAFTEAHRPGKAS